MTKILVTIPSRMRPDQLVGTLALIESHSYSKANYDIQVVIDQEEIPIYDHIIQKNTHINWITSMPHVRMNMRIIYLTQFRYFLNHSEYSLFWYLPDDLTAIPHKWDKLIRVADVFPDGLFCVHSASLTAGRRLISYKTCYTKYDGLAKKVKNWMFDDFMTAYHIGERFPAYSRKWVEYLIKIYEYDKHIIAHDIASAALIRLLYRVHRINRHVAGIGANLDCVDQKLTDKIIRRNPFNRQIFFDICSQMKNYINKKV